MRSAKQLLVPAVASVLVLTFVSTASASDPQFPFVELLRAPFEGLRGLFW